MKKYYPKGDDGKTETKTVQSGIAPNQLIAKRYLTKFEIRKDAMINVHMAFDRERDLNVSLMSLPPEIIKNTDLLADLKLDLSAASKLNHNNIAQLYSIDTWNKIVFCVMEYVPGHTLAAHLEEKGGKLGLDESIPLLRQIASGLDYCHTLTTPLSHLGLKPQNILLTEDNLVKIADFGLANILSSPAARLPGREEPETLAYRAPEQLSGKETGPWTDIYSLAAVAYEMLSGRPPVQGEDLRSQIANQNVKKIDGLPDHVNDALLMALSKEPSNRPKKARDFIAMIAGEKPIPKPGKTQPSQTGKKKSMLLPGFIGVLILFILGGLGFFLSQKDTVTVSQKPAPEVEKPAKRIVIPKIFTEKKKTEPQPDKKTEDIALPIIPEKSPEIKEETILTGKASIVSIPEGAEVFLNGVNKGITPVVLNEIEEGEYDVSIRKEGFEPYTEKMMISSTQTGKVTATLLPIYGTLLVISEPPGAEVYIDSIKSGITPVSLNQVKKGNHHVRVDKPGYEIWTKDIVIVPGEPVSLTAQLSDAMGNISITSNPDDAMIFISGIESGKTPLILKAEKGIKPIEIQKPGYEPWKQNVKVIAGENIEIKAELIQSRGVLQVNSQPSDADVFVSGKNLGKTPLNLKEIQSGKITIEVRKQCYANSSQTVSIKSGILSKIDFPLKPECGTVIVKSDPEDAKWYLDDAYIGNTPGTLENIPAGKHNIKITKDQYSEWMETSAIAPGKSQTIIAKLKPALPDPGATWREPTTGMEFVWVENGCFNMGSLPDELGREEDEGPVHKVCVNGFWIGKYEVTQGQWKAVMKKNPSFFNRKEKYPADSVSINDVQLFVQTLSKTSNGRFSFRLPTEAEWEYACKSGGQAERFSGGDRPNAVAWFKGNSNRTTHSVGEKAPNNINLYDMSGNVSEWVEDTYSADAYKFHSEKNPIHKKSSPNRVIRGGNWSQDEKNCRSAERAFAPAEERNKTIGFRLVKIQ
jgi:formylglycine-generating enzyme required for sulfatase activity/serine/threonine protein kinase